MAKVTYNGSNEKTSTLGHDFVKGVPVEIQDERIINRLDNNKYFEVVEEKKEKEPTVADYKTALKDANVEFDNAAKKDELKQLAEENNLTVEASQN
ncbi:MAG: hypothetical protein JJ964_05785 [Rhizobiales bacterium]|nr:hypothetical protein [Hyphomicrobiales bacterium]